MEKRNDEKADNDDHHDEVWEGVKMKLDTEGT